MKFVINDFDPFFSGMIGRVLLNEEEQMFITGQVLIMDFKGNREPLLTLLLMQPNSFLYLLNNILLGYSLSHFVQLLSKSTKLISLTEVCIPIIRPYISPASY